MLKTKIKRVIALMVTILTIIGTLSSFGVSVSMAASKTAKNMSNGDKVKIGDTTFTVMDTKYNNGVLLLSDSNDRTMKFNSKISDQDDKPYNSWTNSNIKDYLSREYLANNSELAYLKNHGYLLNSITSDNGGDQVFLLSYTELNNIVKNNKKNSSINACLALSTSIEWWLRTADANNELGVYCVKTDGKSTTTNNVSDACAVRPALNISKKTPLNSTGKNQWSLSLETCKVSFVTNDLRDARIQFDDQTVLSGNKATEPTAPSVPGKVFAGYYKDAGYSEKFNFANPIVNNTVIYVLYKDYKEVGIQETVFYPGNVNINDIQHSFDIKFSPSIYQSTGITDKGINSSEIPLPGANGVYTIDLTNSDIATFNTNSNCGTTHIASANVTLDDIFSTLNFPSAGLYSYEFEQTSTDNSGWIYNDGGQGKVYTAIVKVVDDGDALKVDQVYVKENDTAFASFNDANIATKLEKVTFQNIYNPSKNDSSITVTKTVTGTLSDKSKQFEYSLELVFPEYATSEAKANVTMTLNGAGTSEQVDSENYKFTLADGESFVLNNLPIGTIYSVIETPVTGFVTAVTDTTVNPNSEGMCDSVGIGRSADGHQIVGQINVTDVNKVVFKDSIEDVTPTGILLSSTPYMLIIVAVLGLMAAGVINKKKKRVL